MYYLFYMKYKIQAKHGHLSVLAAYIQVYIQHERLTKRGKEQKERKERKERKAKRMPAQQKRKR
jgi:ribose 1,5-bisphosphokinase PhnN